MDNVSPDRRVGALLSRLDDLLAEAARLRAEIGDAIRRRTDKPFWPDRRHQTVPHDPDRRNS